MRPILDISEWQSGLDYVAIAEEYAGAIIRCGGTGYGSAHSVYDDAKFNDHYSALHALGVPVGAYFYAGAIDDAGVDAELRMTKAMLAGKEIQLPVYYDVEVPQGDYLHLTVSERSRLAKRWLDGVKAMGYTPGLYTYLYYTGNLNMDAFADVPSIWMAQYYDHLEYQGRCDLWQYTSTPLDSSKIMDDGKWSAWLGDPDSVAPIDPGQDALQYIAVYAPILGMGDEGPAVKSLQGALEARGYSLALYGGADGIFGYGTEQAVMRYQQIEGLDVDGVVGVQTWSRLLENR